MGKRGPKPKPLDQRQKWAAFLLIWRQSRTKEEIAEKCGVSRMALKSSDYESTAKKAKKLVYKISQLFAFFRGEGVWRVAVRTFSGLPNNAIDNESQ
jgi:MFS superfamily sulfate permease-like transporter